MKAGDVMRLTLDASAGRLTVTRNGDSYATFTQVQDGPEIPKGSFFPPLLMTVNSLSCTRSNVVNLAPQLRHALLRRIAAASSVGRESFTWVSSTPQNGHRIKVLPPYKVGYIGKRLVSSCTLARTENSTSEFSSLF